MDSLVSKSPGQDLLPFEVDGCRLTEQPFDAITWIAPFRNQTSLVSRTLDSEIGCKFPAPNRISIGKKARAISVAPGEALILGAAPDIQGAAIVDQSDAWAVLYLSGELAADALARLTSVDLRDGVFVIGHTARTYIGHMTASLSRIDETTWEILVFRSMAQTAVHDLSRAMKAVVARQEL